MSNIALKDFFAQESVSKKFRELLGTKSVGFMATVLQTVNGNTALKDADPKSVFNAAATAAILDLPINPNLGFAYIVPYKGNAQFQMGYKGFIQLAQRSGQFKTIASAPIYDGQIVEADPLKGYKFDFTVKATGKPIGYAAFFQLLNGFEKTLYMTVDELKAHGKQFSQTFKSDRGLWKDNFDAMASKTVIKLLLSKFAPLSIEMQRAVIADQAVIQDVETQDVTYVDNGEDVAVTAEDVAFLFDMKRDALTESEARDIERILSNKEEASYSKVHKLLKAK